MTPPPHPPTSDLAVNVSAVIRAEMGIQKLSRGDLTAHLGRDPLTVRRRLDGDTPFDLVELAQVAEWLGLSVGALVSRAEQLTEASA